VSPSAPPIYAQRVARFAQFIAVGDVLIQLI
jgi:hypothetical protein